MVQYADQPLVKRSDISAETPQPDEDTSSHDQRPSAVTKEQEGHSDSCSHYNIICPPYQIEFEFLKDYIIT